MKNDDFEFAPSAFVEDALDAALKVIDLTALDDFRRAGAGDDDADFGLANDFEAHAMKARRGAVFDGAARAGAFKMFAQRTLRGQVRFGFRGAAGGGGCGQHAPMVEDVLKMMDALRSFEQAQHKIV